MDPITAIATLAATKFVETGAEKLAGGTLEIINRLREKIWQKLRGKQELEKVLQEAKDGAPFALEQVAGYLDAAMKEDRVFAEEVREEIEEAMKENETFAREIGDRAREIFNIDTVEGQNQIIGDRGIQNPTRSVIVENNPGTIIINEKPD
ncbi:MAG: hypothetical protein J7647_10730 [Cyanobacteria bacterium SBLK]|nr:hypothetical protein [Cyanobacteria bacterium SBLK]